MQIFQKQNLAAKDFYAELNVDPSATMAEIRTAYRQAALHEHPDKGGSNESFHSLSLAFEILSCPASRELYDKTRLQNTSGKLQIKKRRSAPVWAVRQRLIAQRLHKMHLSSRKRKRQEDTDEVPASKAACSERSTMGSRLQSSLTRLQSVLKAMPVEDRRVAITSMASRTRAALLKYMSSQTDAAASAFVTKAPRPAGNKLGSRLTDIRTINTSRGPQYQAQLHIRHLRIYTRCEVQIETAIQHQMVLIQVRHAIERAGDKIWEEPERFSELFKQVLLAYSTSEERIGLGVFVLMRADQWIDRSRSITSPLMTLTTVLLLHQRLVKARASSWEQLRAEWVHLLRCTQQGRCQEWSIAKAEAIADHCRLALLKRQVNVASHAVESAFAQQQRKTTRLQRLQVQEQKRRVKKAVAGIRQAQVLTKKQREVNLQRLKWFRRADLTMEDLKRGPPPHLQSYR